MYVTVLDYTIYISKINRKTGGPTLDPDNCVLWDALTDPPNQEFLNIINARFGMRQNMHDYNKGMTIPDIKAYVQAQKEMKLAKGDMTLGAVWTVKNLREREK